jgi:FkbM family methyltransferase
MLFDRKLEALASDHNSLLSAALRILEGLEELKTLAFRASSEGQMDAAGSSPEQRPHQLLERLNGLSSELNDLFDKHDAANLEVFTSVQALIGSLEDRFGQRLENLRQELWQNSEVISRNSEVISQNSELVSEHLPLHVASSRFGALNPETGLMSHLYSFLPVGTAVDAGANRGDVSRALLDSGYKVYAFEPCPEIFEELRKRLGSNKDCSLGNLALGPADTAMELHIAQDSSADQKYGDASLFNSLVPHAMPPGLSFVSTIKVPVRSLASLASEGEIPPQIGLLKVDTEGFDVQVLRGMGELRPQVVATEFWSPDFVFGQSGASNRLDEIVEEMRRRGYQWHIVLYRLAGSDLVSFYCNYNRPVSDSWGNVFFFYEHALFLRALEWCSAVLPRTYLNVEDATRGLLLAHSDAMLVVLRARIDKLEKLLASQQDYIKQLDEIRIKELNERNQQLNERNQQLNERDQQLNERDQQLNERNQELAAQGREVAAYEEKVARLTKQIKDVQDLLSRAEARFNKMRRSLSWKLTSPLRELRRAGESLLRVFHSPNQRDKEPT